MLPVAQVAVDVSLAHLDRPFEYLVPEGLSEAAMVGCRVRVRFAGRLTSGFLLSRTAEAEHEGRLGYLERVVSPEPVLTPEVAGLARAVADRYGGTLADVLRLAIPPRHAAVEAATRKPAPSTAPNTAPDTAPKAGPHAASATGPPPAAPDHAEDAPPPPDHAEEAPQPPGHAEGATQPEEAGRAARPGPGPGPGRRTGPRPRPRPRGRGRGRAMPPGRRS